MERKTIKGIRNMRAMCVKNCGYHLTPGKIYDLKPLDKSTREGELFDFRVVNDKGYEHYIEATPFVDLEIIRDKRLRALGI